ncbi:MAG: antitoxin MazE-like protein [Planctomycetia bacterium]
MRFSTATHERHEHGRRSAETAAGERLHGDAGAVVHRHRRWLRDAGVGPRRIWLPDPASPGLEAVLTG